MNATELRKHESHMRLAIALALEGAGGTHPNPMVGALVVRRDRIVGEGYHRSAGTWHAEIHALRAAGKLAQGADLYVTLEPCPHKGRTGPCVSAIVEAGVKRVIIGTRDPNPIVNGSGIRALKGAGICVVEGVLGDSCRAINEVYNKYIVSGIPFVTIKAALSLDGKISTFSGDSHWITNDECRRYVHRLRSLSDAVVVGGGTMRADDPLLTARYGMLHGVCPKAVVVSSSLKVPKSARIWKRPNGQVIVITTCRASKSMQRFIEKKGHEVIVCRSTADGRVFLPHMLLVLGRRGLASLLVEGGARLYADFLKRRLVDRVIACIAPKIIGGMGLDFAPGFGNARLKRALELRDVHIQTFGNDVVVEGNVR